MVQNDASGTPDGNGEAERKRVTVHLDWPVYDQLVDLATRNERSVAGQVRYLVTQAISSSVPPPQT